MKKLEINEVQAKVLYNDPSMDCMKSMLEETFGKKFFEPTIIDKIKTFEDACKFLGETTHISDDSSISVSELCSAQLKIIIRALNESHVFNWDDESEKHYPCFKIVDNTLKCVSTAYDVHVIRFGSSLNFYFKTAELAQYAGEHFIKLYNGLRY